MIIHHINEVPSCFSGEYESTTLSDSEIKTLNKLSSIQEGWYWYGAGYYCGAGHLLMRDAEGLWYHHDMGHCSCYGPIDEIKPVGEGRTLDDLIGSCTVALLKELDPLIKSIKG